jgi:hypothetical protein
VPKEIKTQAYQKVVRPSIVYGSESWTLTKNNKTKIDTYYRNEISRNSRNKRDHKKRQGKKRNSSMK